jgi:hypothetical protein
MTQTPAITPPTNKDGLYYCHELVWEAEPNGNLVKVLCLGVYWPGYQCAYTDIHQPRKNKP